MLDHYHDHVRQDVIPYVPKSGGSLLDLGGGIGATAARLKALGHAARVGVADLLPSSPLQELDFFSSVNLEDHDAVRRVLREHGPFRTILCLDVLEHLVDPWEIVALLHEGLEDNGSVIASIPNVRNFRVLLPLLFKNEWQLQDAGILDRTHLRFFVKKSAIELMTSSGLELDLFVSSPPWGRKLQLLNTLTFRRLETFLTTQYIIRCVKRRSQ